MNLLTPEYVKIAKKEKLLRLYVAMFLVLALALTIAIVFMLPSYFLLSLSKNDVLRRLRAAEEVFAKRNLISIENKVGATNDLIDLFDQNDGMRYALSPVLVKIANTASDGIKLSLLELRKNENGFFLIKLSGEAKTRENFLEYEKRLKSIAEIDSIASPVTNLLRESDSKFVLDLNIKKEFYKYESGKK